MTLCRLSGYQLRLVENRKPASGFFMPQVHEINRKASSAFYGAILCWIAVVIYAASNSIVLLLVDIGEQNPVHGHNVVTFSNLFVLGSLISLLPMVAFFWQDWTLENLRELSLSDWAVLVLATTLSSAITPGLFFVALENTTVTNVAIVGRIDPPIFMLAAAVFLKEKLDIWSLIGALVILLGAIVILALKDNRGSLDLGPGEIAAFFATLSFTASTIITRAALQHVPLGVFSIFRTVLGTLIFFLYNLLFSGHHEFHAMFQPVLLVWIWVYAIIIIIAGQFAWIFGLKRARANDVALATSFSPLAAISIAIILLGEDPGAGFLPGAAIMFLGIAVAQFSRWRNQSKQTAIEKAMEMEGRVNFKGI
ncbi:DMT family transporter [Roseovarius sp. CAU 1744]|uniref:DMT family transporter n=1 Tax=Roseovarius sp. CAU 1744 TaxID=3140368 RepID=UPI00325B6DDC